MCAFVYCCWLIVDDILIVIDFYLPTVFGMRFARVYDQELELLLQLLVDLVETMNLGTPDRAGITAELKCDRSAAKIRQPQLLPAALATTR